MRRANSYEIYENKGEFAAIMFGSGSVSEHEHDIKPLLEQFGANEELESTKVPNIVSFFKTDDGKTVLTVGQRSSNDEIPRDFHDYFIDETEHTKLAWSENSFGIITSDVENAKRLEELHEAIQNKDVSFYYEGGIYKNTETNEKQYRPYKMYVGITSRTQDLELESRVHIAETRDLSDKKTFKISQEKRNLQEKFENKIDKELENAIKDSKSKMEKSFQKMLENEDEPTLKSSFERVYQHEKENYEFQMGNLNHVLTMERKKNQYHQFLKTQDEKTVQHLKETYADLLTKSVIDKDAEKETHFDNVGKKLINNHSKEL